MKSKHTKLKNILNRFMCYRCLGDGILDAYVGVMGCHACHGIGTRFTKRIIEEIFKVLDEE